MIAVLNWVDGFGADTEVFGIYDSVETARQALSYDRDTEYPLKYQTIEMNRPCSLDYYEAKYLHPRNKTNPKEMR